MLNLCDMLKAYIQFSSVQSLSRVRLFSTPWTAARQASLSITNSQSLLKLSSPLSQWCHPAISSSVVPFSSCLQSSPASGSFQVCQLFESGGQNIGASASALVLPKSIQGWFPLRLTGLISLLSKDRPPNLIHWKPFKYTPKHGAFWGSQLMNHKA